MSAPNKSVSKLTLDELVGKLQTYQGQADASLSQLKKNIDEANAQINEWQKLSLMIVGQKQLLKELLNMILESPVEGQVNNPAVKQ